MCLVRRQGRSRLLLRAFNLVRGIGRSRGRLKAYVLQIEREMERPHFLPSQLLQVEGRCFEDQISRDSVTKVKAVDEMSKSDFHPQQDLAGIVNESVEKLLANINYEPPPSTEKGPVRGAVEKRATEMGIPIYTDNVTQICFETGLSVASDMYPLHPLKIQVHIATFTWLGFLIDDLNGELGADLSSFQYRLIKGEQQPSKLLAAFAVVLGEVYEYYESIVANFIVLSALAFINANTIEVRQEYQNMRPPLSAADWPYYFRDKEGLPEVYAYYCFPKSMYPDFTAFISAIPDMARFINLTNDVLSFYKEEKAGEKRNYLHKTIRHTGHSIQYALQEAATLASDLYSRSRTTLEHDVDCLTVWTAYVMGYVAMHLRNRRYQLAEVLVDSKYML